MVLKGLTARAMAAPLAQPNDLGGAAMKDLMARKPIEGSSSR